MAQLYFDSTSVAVGQNDSSENTVSDDSLLIDNKWNPSDSDDAAFKVQQAATHRSGSQPSTSPGVGNKLIWQGGNLDVNQTQGDNNPNYSTEAHPQPCDYKGTFIVTRPQHSTSDEADEPLLSTAEEYPGFSGSSINTSHCHSLRFESPNSKAWQNLLAVSILCLTFMIIEIVGGYLAGSVAVMTDAAHLLSDLIGFIVSLSAVGFSTRPATRSYSFGFFRVEILGALVSTWIIWVLSSVFLYIAIHRLITADFTINADYMLIVASIGVVINILMGVLLHGMCKIPHSHGHTHSSHERLPELEDDSFEKIPELNVSQPSNINVRAAFIHILGDLTQSIAVVISAIIIKCLGSSANIADPICTLLSSILVLIITIPVLRDTGRVLLEGFPPNLDYRLVLNTFQCLPQVRHAHSLHVWSLTLDKLALSIHLAVDSQANRDKVLQSALVCARDKFGIMYSTIQIELYDDESITNCASCQIPN